VSDRELFLAQVEKLVRSDVLRGSESLCKLLRYLAQHSLDHPGVHLKEYQIATEVFGRPEDFDPQSDSTIRVQAGRLRAKLADYYSTEGAGDDVEVELPKGNYAAQFHLRSANTSKKTNIRAVSIGPSATSEFSTRKYLAATVVLATLLVVALVAIGALLTLRQKPIASAKADRTLPPELPILWGRFLSGPDEPWVVFSNAAFVGRPETGMRYFNSNHDSRDLIWDHYTGVGEVLAVHHLDQMFSSLRQRIRVKRGSLFSLDDAQNNDLIFVGSPSENLTLLDIPGTQQFVFKRLDAGPRKGDLAVVNVHPQTGEARVFLASPSPAPVTEDYSVIGFMPGLDPARSVMILAGTTTFGTEAAVEFVCRPESVRELLSRLAVQKASDLKPFEALLRVKISRGVPVESELVAVRQRSR